MGGRDIIHSYIGRGVVRDTFDNPELARRPVRFFTFQAA